MAYQHTNILGTQKMLEFAVEKKVPQFVFASSSSVYGEMKKRPGQKTKLRFRSAHMP
jgi:UDP-glucuronate 4-epimerase